jgi:signal transduction histidine kinase
VSAPAVIRHVSPVLALLSAFGFENAAVVGASSHQRSVLAAFVVSDTFRWLRRWAAIGVVAIVTPLTVVEAYADNMPEFHHVAVPIAVAIIVPIWVAELLGVGWPRIVLIAATVLPNLWLTGVGHNSTNYLWFPLLVAWVAFAGTTAESIVALVGASTTVGLAVVLAPAIGWAYWVEWVFSFLLAWFMGLSLRRQVVLVSELRLVRAQAEQTARDVAVLEERQRLSRELHDSVTQSLYGISLYAAAADRALSEGEREPVASNLHEIQETTHEALGEMRLLLFELRPPLLQEQGLAAALRARLQTVEARSGLISDFDCEDEQRLPADVEQELYRLAQEALNNVLKHAHAGRVSVRLAVANGRTTMEVADDGVGFDPSLQGTGGFGLSGMRERAERLGGTVRIESSPGTGTRVLAEVPR